MPFKKKQPEETKELVRNPGQLKPPTPPPPPEEPETTLSVADLPEWRKFEEMYLIAKTASETLNELLEYEKEMLQELRNLVAEVKNG